MNTTTTDLSNSEFIPHHQDQLNEPLLLHPSSASSQSILSDELHSFRISLKWCALDHSSCTGKFFSYLTFILFTFIIPVVCVFSIKIPHSSNSSTQLGPVTFNKLVQLPLSGLALIAFFTLSSFFRKYGLGQVLLLSGLKDDSCFVRSGYSRELDKAFRYLACMILPAFFVEFAHKVIFFSIAKVSLPFVNSGVPLNSIMFVLVLASWVYRTGVFLLVCALFRLTCELQILRFAELHKMFEGCESDFNVIFKEHVRIKKQLSATSHRYRGFIITSLVTTTVSQLGALLLVLAFKSDKSFFSSGDLVICSVVEISGFFLCLLGAARITHRAQGIVSVATRWHMIMTSVSGRSDQLKSHMEETNGSPDESSNNFNYCSSNSSDIFVSIPSPDPFSFQPRQALVSYLQHNHGGITLFGFTLDRGLLHTIFAFEFSLVLWILSKVVVLS